MTFETGSSAGRKLRRPLPAPEVRSRLRLLRSTTRNFETLKASLKGPEISRGQTKEIFLVNEFPNLRNGRRSLSSVPRFGFER